MSLRHSAGGHVHLGPIACIIQQLRRWQSRRAMLLELSSLSDGEYGRMLRDLRVSDADFVSCVRGSNHAAADLLPRRIDRIGLDPDRVDRAVLADLQMVCSACTNWRRCMKDLDSARTEPSWRDFCPNAMTLSSLTDEVPHPG